MKTLTYLPTLLALIIQVMVSGQTQNSQARKIRVDIMGKKEPVKMIYTNSNITLSITEYNRLVGQANELKNNLKKLRDEADLTEQNYIIKQIEASRLSGQISFQKFEENKKTILVFFTQQPTNIYTYTAAKFNHVESERFMKLAREIREEADAQLTLQAKIGSMSNAEEKEAEALAKQNAVLVLFEKNYPQLYQKTLIKSSQENVTLNNEFVVSINDTENKAIMSESIVQDPEQLMESLFEALKQADNMKVTVQELKTIAVNASDNEKQILMNEVVNLENEYVVKRLEVSNLKAKLTYDKFLQNRYMISELINNVKDNNEVIDFAIQLNMDAERLLKISKEMREEANAQLTISAKYAAMSNAEETERFAVSKQVESIQSIEKLNSQLIVASR